MQFWKKTSTESTWIIWDLILLVHGLRHQQHFFADVSLKDAQDGADEPQQVAL